jgi:protein-disulfide isomerase
MKREAKNLLLIAIIVLLAGIAGVMLYRQSVPPAPVPSKPDIAEKLVRPDSPVLGPADAKITIVEFLDPECETCAAFGPKVKDLMKEYEGQIRLVIRYMPLHKNSRLAASYLEAAAEQGKYWEFLDIIFKNQDEWGEIHGHGPQPVRPEPRTLFDKWAAEIGLNVEQLKASAADPKHSIKVDRDLSDGRSLGVRKTPTFFVNGREMTRFSEPELRRMVSEAAKN